MRGAATTIALGKFDITAFYSNRRVDANLLRSDSLDETEAMVSSLQESGYHRIPTELADKGAIHEIAEGGHINYMGQRLRGGITMYHVDYDKPFATQDALYKKFQPTLNSNTYLGADYSYNYKYCNLTSSTKLIYSHLFYVPTKDFLIYKYIVFSILF